MSNLIKSVEKIKGLYKAKGCSNEQIIFAEKSLNIKFVDEYKEYLKTYGAISFNSVELTGLNVDSYVNVVDVTKKERSNSEKFPKNCIVIENTGCEGLLILQNTEGEIFEWSTSGRYIKIFNSLSEYIVSLIM